MLSTFRPSTISAGEVALLLHTVTNHHRFLQEFGIFLQDDVESGPVGGGKHLRGVADAGYLNIGTVGDTETESTIHLGYGTNGGIAHDNHGNTRNRCALGVYDGSANGAIQGEGQACAQQVGRKYHCDSRHFG